LSLSVSPPIREVGGEGPKPDWSDLFAAAELNVARLTPADPMVVPPMYCDTRAAWSGTYPNNPETPLRVEAGSYRGVPVFFHAGPDWTESLTMGPPRNEASLLFSQIMSAIVYLVSPIGAVFLARRNLALNRGDRRGAFRITLFIAIATMLSWLLWAGYGAAAGPGFE